MRRDHGESFDWTGVHIYTGTMLIGRPKHQTVHRGGCLVERNAVATTVSTACWDRCPGIARRRVVLGGTVGSDQRRRADNVRCWR
jgi:hypothetical protein